MEHKLLLEKITSSYLLAALGDGYLVPFEFCSRDYIREHYPGVEEPMGYLTHNQPPLTFSDDTSLLCCLTESLIEGYDLEEIGKAFVRWIDPTTAYWSARGEIFDVGATTAKALRKIKSGVSAAHAGDDSINSNGNAGTSRSLALAFYTLDMPVDKIFQYVKEVSSITHRHPISIITAFYYVIYIQHILSMDKFEAYYATNRLVKAYLQSTDISPNDIHALHRVLEGRIPSLEEREVYSTPYCVYTLECSLWCVLHTTSSREALDLVGSLGEDTDSNGFVTMSMSALVNGRQGVEQWIPQLARYNDIVNLAERFSYSLANNAKLTC